MTMKNRTTSDALEIIYDRYYRGRPERQAQLEKTREAFERRERARTGQANGSVEDLFNRLHKRG